jgi:hypothetical protein
LQYLLHNVALLGPQVAYKLNDCPPFKRVVIKM